MYIKMCIKEEINWTFIGRDGYSARNNLDSIAGVLDIYKEVITESFHWKPGPGGPGFS
jgi:hypothetical protein